LDIEVTNDFPNPVCIPPDGGTANGNILFEVRNSGLGAVTNLSLLDERAVSTVGGQLFYQFVVCFVDAGVCEFRPADPQNVAACNFVLAQRGSLFCAIPQSVDGNTRSFGENANLLGTDSCTRPVSANSTIVNQVTNICP
jgi:hypothetical protein